MAVIRIGLIFAVIAKLTAANPWELEERAGDICSTGFYSEIVPVLKPYSVAQSFCRKAYPPVCTSQNKVKRAPSTTTAAPGTPPPKITKNQVAALSKLLQKEKQVISAICSCIIQTHQLCSTTSTPTTTTTPTPTSTSTTPTTPTPTITSTTTTSPTSTITPTTTTTTSTSTSSTAPSTTKPLDTIYVSGGLVGFTSTINTVDALGSPTAIVVIGVPA